MPDNLGNVLSVSAGLGISTALTPEQENKMVRLICGSAHDVDDAKLLIEACGLEDTIKELRLGKRS